MFCVTVTLLLVIPQIAFAQQLLQGGHRSGASEITCPKLSCHLHNYPQEHCRVQTFFVYHGLRCKGCTEDICYGSQAVADSLIGNDVAADNIGHTDMAQAHSHGGPDRHQLPGEWNRFNGIRARLVSNEVPAHRRTTSFIFGATRPAIGKPNVDSIARDSRGPSSRKTITCPKIECELHHKPKEHCIVESYFLYQGRRCAGCTEDICLGAHTVKESLIGKNDTADLHTGESHKHQDLHSERPDVLQIGQIDKSFQRPNSNSQSPMRQMFENNRNTFRGNTLRTNLNLVNRNLPWTQNRDRTNNFRSFGQRNGGRTSNWRTNDRNLMSSSTTNNRQDSPTGNADDVVVIKEEPTSPLLKNGKGIQRFTGGARTYLQSLFHPAFSG